MKMQERERSVVYSGVSLEDLELFSMEADPIAFEIMSSGIYSKKVRAVVRELSTNAFDENFKVAFDKLVKNLPQQDQDRLVSIRAECSPLLAIHQLQRTSEQRKELHRLFALAAEIEPPFEDVLAVTEPIEVHLPNANEPWFSVTDNGRGMEDKFARKIFTTYFKSDKRDTNSLNGCFGLGSKSPFCYTDQFTVTSRYNGTKRVYTFLVTELAVPGCLPVSEEPTDEPNGVEVMLGVEANDFYQFTQEAQNIYRWFAVRPNVWGSADFEWPTDDEFLFESKGYKVYGTKKNKGTHVVMANVAYPIVEDNFTDEVREAFTEAELRLLKHGVILHVGNGEVKMAASREALQMVDITVNTIKERLGEVAKNLVQDVQAKIDTCSNVWEARLMLRGITHESVIGTIARKADHKITYNGEILEDSVLTYKEEVIFSGTEKEQQKVRDEVAERYKDQSVDKKDLKEWQNNAVQKAFAVKEKTVFCKAEFCDIQNSRRRRGHGYAQVFGHEFQVEIIPSADQIIIIDDLDGKGAYIRVQKWLEDTGKKNVTLIKAIPEYDLNKWLEETGVCHVETLYTSELDVPEREGRSPRGDGTQKKTAKAVVCTGRFSYETERDTWEDATVELDDGGVYVEVHRYRWSAGDLTKNKGTEDNENFCVPSNLEQYYRVAKLLDPNLQLYGLRKALANSAGKVGHWISLDDWIKAKYAELCHLAEDRAKFQAFHAVSIHRKNDLVKMFKDTEFDADSPFGQVIADLHEWQKLGVLEGMNTFENTYETCAVVLGLKMPSTKTYEAEVKDLERRSAELYNLYPMMALVEWNRVEYSGREQVKLTEYIRLCDEQRNLEHVLAMAGLGKVSKTDLKIA